MNGSRPIPPLGSLLRPRPGAWGQQPSDRAVAETLTYMAPCLQSKSNQGAANTATSAVVCFLIYGLL